MAKRKSKRASSRPKGKAEPEIEIEEGSPSWLTEAWGLLLLSISLVTVIALLSEFVHPVGANLLGPYVGDWWANTLNHFTGMLPVLFLVAAVAVLGFKLVLARGGIRLRIVLALALLFVTTGILLSVRNLGKERLAAADYQMTGGYLGNFLVKTLFMPIFGPGTFGPYLLTGLALVFTLIWGFRLSVVAVSEKGAAFMVLVLRPFFQGLVKAWTRPPAPEPLAAAAPPSLETLARARPESRKRGADKAVGMDKAAGPEALRETAGAGQKSGSGLTAANVLGPNGEVVVDALPADFNLDEVDLDSLDPLTVRKLRDLDLERKRVSELNEWEVRSRNPEIAGLLLKEKAREKAGRNKEPEAVPAAIPVGGALPAEPEIEPAKPGKKKGKRNAAEETLAKVGGEAEFPPSEVEALTAEDLAEIEELRADGPEDEFTEEAGAARTPESPAPKPASAPAPVVKYDPYRVPNIDDLFSDPPKQPLEFTEEELREQSKLLEDQLLNFKVMGKVTQILPGPVITRYEVELAPGVKVNRISSLSDDLALALRAKSIRILAPIPGKSVVGIEVPNRKAQIVYIKEILKAAEFAVEEDTLKICVGKTIAGEPYVMDLTRAPHLLIAGQTGSGKSVCINSIMASFLCSKSPDELRMILVDPKVVELKPYDEIHHLLYPVITQPEVAVSALKWSTVEMDRRYEVLAQSAVRNIKGFNQKFREGRLPEAVDVDDRKLMPYIVIIIDELADLMMVAGKEVETNIARIAQKARAVGIHLILATQRPSTNVITGTIKANLPTRIAFQVASQIDARTVLDKMGAEKLLGRGDMLFRPIDFPEPMRLHGCYLDDDQAEKLAGAASGQFVNYPQIVSFSMDDDPGSGPGSDEPRDEKFREAAELVVQVKQASVSLLQRRLGIGYARSGRLVDQLERAGVVGKERGSKPREVLMNEEELNSFLSSGLNDD